MATHLLQQVEHKSVGITMEDAQNLLKNPDFLSEILATTQERKVRKVYSCLAFASSTVHYMYFSVVCACVFVFWLPDIHGSM